MKHKSSSVCSVARKSGKRKPSQIIGATWWRKLFYQLGGDLVSWCPTLWDPMDCSRQAPLSMGFFRQEYWSGLPFPSPGDLPDPGIEPGFPALQEDSLLTELWGKLHPIRYKALLSRCLCLWYKGCSVIVCVCVCVCWIVSSVFLLIAEKIHKQIS